MSIRR